MSTEYHLRIYNRSGVLQAVVANFLSFAYRHQRNAPGILEFTIDPSSAGAFELDGVVEVWRRVPGGAWYADFTGLYRWQQQGMDADGRHWLKVRCPGLLHLCSRAIVGYAKGVAGRSTFTTTKAETIIKALVTYNATSAGTTADGRLRSVTLAGVQLEGDAARGNAIDFECSFQNLLTSIQRVATVGGGDFTLSKVAATAFEFAWIPASDSGVVFAPNYGNMATPVLTRNWMDEKTTAIAGANGVYGIANSADYVAAYRDAEVFVSAPNYTTTDGLTAAAEAALLTRRADDLTFEVLQTPQATYGVHYQFLDWVTAYFAGVEKALQIQEVGVAVAEDGAESIQVVCRE